MFLARRVAGIAIVCLLAPAHGATNPESVTCIVASPSYPTIQSAVDDSNCTIIEVGAGLFPENVRINRSLMLRGEGMESTLVTGDTLAGEASAIFAVGSQSEVFLADLAIEKGTAGGIVVLGSSLTVERSKIAHNTTSADGGGIFVTRSYEGGEIIDAALTLINSAVTHNAADVSGGGISNWGGKLELIDTVVAENEATYYGGGIRNSDNPLASGCDQPYGEMTISNSTIHDNAAGINAGGIYNDTGNLMMEESAIANNVASNGVGGGLYNIVGSATVVGSTFSGNGAIEGGAIFTDYSHPNLPESCARRTMLTVENSTFSDNEALLRGGALYFGGGGAYIESSTVTGNRAGSHYAGGIHSWWQDGLPCKYGDCTPHAITLTHSIVANSLGGGDCMIEDDARFGDAGYNLVEDSGCLAAPTSLSGDPRVDSLAYNGGPTATHALLAGSPAIDTGAECSSTDQRGFVRPLDGDGDGVASCDIGSYERLYVLDLVHLPLVFR